MAYTPLVPATLNATMTQARSQVFTTAPIVNPAGTAVDLSAWVSLEAHIAPTNPSPTGTNVTFGGVSASALGVVTLQTTDSDLAALPTGSAKLIISGKPTSGDIVQLLATGILTLGNG